MNPEYLSETVCRSTNTMSVYNSVNPGEDESHQAISSYFLGPKAENYEYFKKNILEILEGQSDARLDYFPRDSVCSTTLAT